MCDEEESMELSGESNLVSNLHNFSFDVSWSHDPSPPVQRRGDMLSPARFVPCSTPKNRAWKSLTLDQHHRELLSPTVKVSQKTCSNYFQNQEFSHKQDSPPRRELPSRHPESPRRQSYSPMELDHPENNYETKNMQRDIRKRHTIGDFQNCSQMESPVKAIEEFHTPREPKYSIKTPLRKKLKSVNHNNNIKDDYDLEDTVFLSDPDSPGQGPRVKRPTGVGSPVSDKKSSVFVLLLVVLVSCCIGVYLYLQVDSCAVFDIDVVKLRHKLEDNVYGQHIAVKSVLDSLVKFEKEVKSGSEERTLVLSFHGWTGVGKNYISKFISEAFYNARTVLYLIPLHFAHVDRSDGVVEGWITGNITKCGVNVLIFDEIDKASVPLLAEIQSALESVRRGRNGEDDDSSPVVVVIFISNSKSNQINQFLFSQLVIERERELIRLQEFEAIFDKSSGEWFEGMKSKNLIDYFVPFFPLAESHVKDCIVKEFVKRGRDPDEEMVIAVMNELSFFDMGGHNGQLSLTGCKRVQDKIDLHIDD